MMQANTGIAPLDAVLATAAMVTPEQTPTVAAQVVQAAQQKMQPQGIMGGMPQARQDFRTAAEIDNMKRMQMQQAMQQMAAQMTARPAGIEELPAKNMRDMQRMAGGGVIGFDGRGEFGSYVPEAVALDELRVAEAKRKREEEQEKLKQEFLRSAGVEIPATPAVQSPILTRQQQESMVKPSVSKSYASGIDEVLAAANRASAPAPRPPAPATRPPAPQSGIAQLVEPTPEQAMASARSIAGFPATDKLRTKEEAYLEALKRQPVAGQQGLAALQEQQAALKAMHDKAEKQSNINAAIQWLLGADTPGGPARSSIAFAKQEDERRRVYQELQVANATKRDAIIDLQNAREANNARAALEAEQRIRAAEMDVAKAEATLSGQLFQTQGELYRTKMTSADRAADRAQQAMLEGARLKQQAEQNGQMQLANRINAANMTVASAIEKMDKDLEKKYGQVLSYKKMMPPDQFSKNPGFVENYQQYLAERDEKYRVAVEPAVRERDRLAAQVMSGGGGNVQRYDAKGNPIK